MSNYQIISKSPHLSWTVFPHLFRKWIVSTYYLNLCWPSFMIPVGVYIWYQLAFTWRKEVIDPSHKSQNASVPYPAIVGYLSDALWDFLDEPIAQRDPVIVFNISKILASTLWDGDTIAAILPLQWSHNGRDGVSNHQPRDCLLSRLFRRRSKKTSKLRVTGLCAGNSPGPVNSPHKWPVTWKKVSIWWHHHRKTFSNAFSCVRIVKLWLKFHWNLFPRV